METLKTINFIIAVIFFVCYTYQFLYIPVPWLRKEKPHGPAKANRYAVLICARNEQRVIGDLIASLRGQTYDQSLLSIFVLADNCTDDTAMVARVAGAHVYERFNQVRVGKGYALQELLEHLEQDYPRGFDGYFVFDADNILAPNYVEAMNRTFSDGHEIITSFRNSKNYGDNWISAGYALWFLRESRFLNGARMKLGTSCAISGTGFLVATKVFREDNGWKFNLLTEDIQFSTAHIIRGDKIGYCKDAVLYDEQPVTFKASWNQRLRWTKGFYQVFARYGKDLVKGIVLRHSFQCYDMLMVIAPATLLTLASLLFNGGCLLAGLASGTLAVAECAASGLGGCLLSVYFSLLAFGIVTLIAEQKQIHCSKPRQILYLLMFPVFIFTYIPMAVVALRKNVTWKHIPHSILCTADQICEKK